MDKTHILNEIRRTTNANGGVPLGWKRFLSETGIAQSDWYAKYWARWSDALREAGVPPNQMTEAYDDDELLDKYADLTLELGRVPTNADMRLKAKTTGFPAERPFYRFGPKPKLIARLVQHCQGKDHYVEVIRLCGKYVPREQQEPEFTGGDGIVLGFVYLMKSGKHYKIGHTNSYGRREYELAIQLPERASTVHVIRTDDPPGIEAYWHRRFEAKRKNGEWFELEAADVAAFRRRKFM